MLHYDVLCYVTHYVNKYCYIMLRWATLRYVVLQQFTLCYITLRYVILRHVTLRYVTFRFVTLLRYVTFDTLRYFAT